MDFQSLSRRELQALCKNNKIPANMTNVAMADALAALSHVEGLEELGRDPCETPLRRTAARTTARKKTATEREPEGSVQSTRTRRGMTKVVSEKTEEDEENININSLTPAVTTSQRRAPAVSARSKLASEKVDKKKAPTAATGQSAYSTRRSTRLLEKTMAELTLTNKKIAEPSAMDEGAPKEVNMTQKETLKPIRMEELHAEDMSKGVSDEEVNMTEKETLKPIKMEELHAEDMSRGVSDEDEEKKDTEDEKSSVIPETESKREVVDVPDLKEATKEETLNNDAEENKEENKAASNGDVVDDNAIITEVEGGERDLGSGAELLVEVDEKVESEEGEKSLLDAEKVEENADPEVMDDQSIVAAENANEEDEGTQLSIGFTAVTSMSTPVASVQKMKEKESGKEELLLQVYADPESVAANNTTPAAASVQKTRLLSSPYSAATLKSSSKALVNENKENNNIQESARKVAEPSAGHANAVEVVIQKKKIAAKCLEDMNLRELTKMLKEKLVITNNEDSAEAPANLLPKKQEQVVGKKAMIRRALQTLPQNLQAVGEVE